MSNGDGFVEAYSSPQQADRPPTVDEVIDKIEERGRLKERAINVAHIAATVWGSKWADDKDFLDSVEAADELLTIAENYVEETYGSGD